MKALLIYKTKKGKEAVIYLPADFPYGISPNFITTQKLIFEVSHTELRIDTMTYYIYANKVK
ncbi:MAG TPA: hypothetical protein VFC41_01480 [Anaerovoracaceae bacterium]|nr:hypothetical protein [Anaerovoracaceae bacterium]